MALQKVSSSLKWEVIIIDNASTDQTTEVAFAEWHRHNLNVPFRLLYEASPGLSNARARGFNESTYDFIVFCDDDNWLDPEYVMNAFQLMISHPEAGVIGGKSMPVFEDSPPSWFDAFKKHFAVGTQGDVVHGIEDLSEKQRYVFGASAVFRKQALNVLFNSGHQMICEDRNGSRLLSGGDNELCYCMIILGYKVYYASFLTFKHFMPVSRLSIKYLLNLNFGAGYSQAMLLSYGPFLYALPEKKVRWYFQLAVHMLGLTRSSFVDRFIKRKTLLEWKVPAYKRMGAIVAVWRERRKIARQLALNRDLVSLKALPIAHKD